jgi:hypothetical protein
MKWLDRLKSKLGYLKFRLLKLALKPVLNGARRNIFTRIYTIIVLVSYEWTLELILIIVALFALLFLRY